MGYLALNGTKLIPAPFLSIGRQYVRSTEGDFLSKQIVFTITGKAVKGKGGFTHTAPGYPADDFTDEPLEDLLAKEADLEALVDSAEWVYLEIQPDPEGSAPSVKWRVKPQDLTFVEGNWTNFVDYTLTLEGQLGNGTQDFVEGIEESWQLIFQEDPVNTYSLTHNISCTSKESFLEATLLVKEGWKNSQNYLVNTMGGDGVDNSIVQGDPGFALGAAFAGYNHEITKTINETGGIYQISESWVMSENPFFERQSINVQTERDVTPVGGPDATITISGEVVGLRQDDGTGFSDAEDQWTGTVRPSLLATAQSHLPVGFNSLHTEPKSTQENYNEITRTVSYSYIYDNGDGDCITNLTINVSKVETNCPDIQVVVAGSVQGVETADDTAYVGAKSCWTTLEPTLAGEALTAYTLFGGTGTLRGPYDKTVNYGERDGRITFNIQYIDKVADITHDKRITQSFDKIQDVTTVVVAGHIVAICSSGLSVARTEFDDNASEADSLVTANLYYSGNDTLGSSSQSNTVTYDERRNTIDYSYSFDDKGEDGYNEDISFTVRETNDNCGRVLTTMTGAIQGRRTTSPANSAYANALARFNGEYLSADPSLVSDFSSMAKRTSKSIVYNEFNSRINFTYEFSDEQNNWIIDETITQTYGEDCGFSTITQTGTVTGMCTGGLESSYANAVLGYVAVVTPPTTPSTGATFLSAKSRGDNPRRGTINYSFTYTDRPQAYLIDETVTTDTSTTSRADTITYNGTVTGYCSDTDSSDVRFSNAQLGWASQEPVIANANLTNIEVRRIIGNNTRQGTISYTVTYRNNNGCITDSLQESITVVDEDAVNVFAVVPILGGPSVIQNKGGTTVKRRTITINVTVAASDNCVGTKPDVEALIDTNEPSATIVMVDKDTETWSPLSGDYNRVKSWTYTDC